MSLSKKLEKLIRSSPDILPVKTEEGILVGTVLIKNEGYSKSLYRNSKVLYKDINLNIVAIKLANILARGNSHFCDEIYRADQDYGKWFCDSQLLRSQYERAKQRQDYERADMLWARYIESRDRAIIAKNRAEALTKT